MNRRKLGLGVALACGVAVFGAQRLHVFADGAPENPSLFYSGTLEQDGALVSGKVTVALALYGAATGGGDPLCTVSTETDVSDGRFRIDATDCTSALRDNANTWAEVSFTGNDGVTRAIDGRTKIGAVPYALEADRAIAASNATGALEERLTALTARIDDLEAGSSQSSAFQAVRTDALSVDASSSAVVPFNDVIFDAGKEYDPATGIFSPKTPGVYSISCIIAWGAAGGTVAMWEAALLWNDQVIFISSDISDGSQATRTVQAVMQLAPGEHISCRAANGSNQTQPLDVEWAHTTFEAHRYSE